MYRELLKEIGQSVINSACIYSNAKNARTPALEGARAPLPKKRRRRKFEALGRVLFCGSPVDSLV
jgi:hypothetical protein